MFTNTETTKYLTDFEVRRAALECAIELLSSSSVCDPDKDAPLVVGIARMFEKYLRGPEEDKL